jgi:nucleotide-binding universal stress UspA family protein
MFERILLAYDGSDRAEHAADYVKELALKFGSQVDVVYTYGPVPHGWGEHVDRTEHEAAANQGAAIVGDVLDRLKSSGVDAEGEAIEGLASEVIIHRMGHDHSDLIVIGSRGWGQTTSFLLGGVCDKVVHSAACPVLVVK